MVIIQSISLRGHRKSNEDAELIFLNHHGRKKTFNKLNIYSVFDGHGGDAVSKYLEKNYINYFGPLNRPKPTETKKKYQKYIIECYKHIQTKLKTECKNIVNYTGTAALSIIHYKVGKKNMLYVINLGDCRAVLCNKFNVAIPLTKDHKPTNYEETIRIHKLGGKIIQEHGDDPRIEGLSLSRAFGDLDTKPYVSHIPEIFRYELDSRDQFIILACDGLWDAFQNQQAVDFVLNQFSKVSNIKSTNKQNKKNIAYLLAQEAIKRGSDDNVSVIIIKLQ